MRKSQPTNLAASIRGRLLHRSKVTQRPFAELLQYYAIERFLYRLSCSPYRDKFYLRGALLFIAWRVETHRPTMDIDLLAKIDNTKDTLAQIVKEICEFSIQDKDGIVFLADTIQAKEIQLKAEYEGVRLSFHALLGSVKIFMQIDIGFGDVISPKPEALVFPAILQEFLPTQIKGYTRETLVAEKLHAMVKRQLENTRMKDFFDIWFLSEQFIFLGQVLARAVEETFKRRKTDIPSDIISLLDAFQEIREKKQQWDAFSRKNQFKVSQVPLHMVMQRIGEFLNPVLIHLHQGNSFITKWTANELWQDI